MVLGGNVLGGVPGPAGPLPDPLLAARVIREVDQTIPDTVHTAIIFDTEQYDYGGFWNVANPTRLTLPTSGVYTFFGGASYYPRAAGRRMTQIMMNGAVVLASQHLSPVSNDVVRHNLSVTYKASVGDFFELDVWQTSGAPLDCQYWADHSCALGICLVRRT